MAEGKGGKILNFTRKRARRATEKMMQKFGYSETTKDEVYEEFVNNFQKQHTAATRLQKELLKYINSIRMLYQSTKSLRDLLGELYEPEWEGYGSYRDVMEQKVLMWEDLLTTLQSKVVEPMTDYSSKFPEVKSRVSKRERKVVDYDMRRRELEGIKAKGKASEQKVHSTEESYTQAKQLYDEITDDLYEELPAFYDSRIQFYAQVFQSIGSSEARFHAETAKIDEQFSVLMDGLAAEAATGVHSTKKERSVHTAVPKLLSRPEEDSDKELDEQESPEQSEVSAEARDSVTSATNSLTNSVAESPTTSPIRSPSESEKKPSKPAPFSGSLKRQPPTKPLRSPDTVDTTASPSEAMIATATTITAPSEDQSPSQSPQPTADPPPEKPPVTTPPAETMPPAETTPPTETTPPSESQPDEAMSPHSKQPPPKPTPLITDETDAGEQGVGPTGKGVEPENKMEDGLKQNVTSNGLKEPEVKPEKDEPMVEGESTGDTDDQQRNVLFKVVSTHPYQGEDEDELTFEKGVLISVIPYDDPDDEEEGWLNGTIEGTGRTGIFPENFTKRQE